jgi:hypothetical protein
MVVMAIFAADLAVVVPVGLTRGPGHAT